MASQKNAIKIALIGVTGVILAALITAVATLVASSQDSPDTGVVINQSTSGDHSPAVSNVKGNVVISIQPKEEVPIDD